MNGPGQPLVSSIPRAEMPEPYPSDHENAIPLDRVTGDPFPARLRRRSRATRGGTRIKPSALGPISSGCPVCTGLPVLALGPVHAELSTDALGPVNADVSVHSFGAFHAELSPGAAPGGSVSPSRASSGGTAASCPAACAAPPSCVTPWCNSGKCELTLGYAPEECAPPTDCMTLNEKRQAALDAARACDPNLDNRFRGHALRTTGVLTPAA